MLDHIEYILQRKATEHRKNERMDLAIACLRKSNEIMPHSDIKWAKKDYLRLVEYLKENGQYDEATQVEYELSENLPEIFCAKTSKSIVFRKTLKECSNLGTDLVECVSHEQTCGICSKYQDRIYSISGKDKDFPKLPEIVLKYGGFHEGCRHGFYPFLKNCSTPTFKGNPIKMSNRPYIDKRSNSEKIAYNNRMKKIEIKKQAKKEYDKIRRLLPELAPKSLSGYSNMKNKNSPNFLKLTEEAEKKGIVIVSIK